MAKVELSDEVQKTIETTVKRRAGRFRTEMTILYVITFIAVIGVAYVAGHQQSVNSSAARRQAAEDRQTAKANTERRDQNCLVFESAHLQEVTGLRQIYGFLAATPRTEWDATQKFAYVQLPRAEAEAHSDRDNKGARVPTYCDEPGARAEKLWRTSKHRRGQPPVGLPEPDPAVPSRPRSLR